MKLITSYGKRDSEEVIKDFEMDRLSRIIRGAGQGSVILKVLKKKRDRRMRLRGDVMAEES